MRWVAFLCFLSFSTSALALEDCNAKFPKMSQLEERLKCFQSNNNDLQSQIDAIKPQNGGSSAKQAIAKPEAKPSKAYGNAPQPLTRAKPQSGVSSAKQAIAKPEAKPSKAYGNAPQPLTRADCKKAGLQWNNNANVCGGKQATAKSVAKPSKFHAIAAQPLTRADCKKAGLQWNNNANVCGR